MSRVTISSTDIEYVNGATVYATITGSADTLTLSGAAAANVTVTGVAEPSASSDAATKNYVDSTTGGDVSGPGAAVTNNAIVRWDGTTGTLIQNSTATVDDVGNMFVTGTAQVGKVETLDGVIFSGTTGNNNIVLAAGLADAFSIKEGGNNFLTIDTTVPEMVFESAFGLTLPSITQATTIHAANGVVSDPSYSFNSDQNTGMWLSAADTLNFSTGGVEAVKIDSSQNVTVTGNIAAVTDVTTDIGTSSVRINDCYIGGTLIINNITNNPTTANKNNILIGSATTGDALPTNTGDNNICVGSAAGTNITGGSNNICFGKDAGDTILTGNQNTFLGNGADGTDGADNQTAVGYGAECDGPDQVVLGNASVTIVRPMSNASCNLGDQFNAWDDVYSSSVTTATLSVTDIDRASAGPLNIGASVATSVSIADTGVTTTVQGQLHASGVIRFFGLTGTNQIRVPDNLPNALTITDGTQNYVRIVSSTGGDQVDILQNLDVTGTLTVSGNCNLTLNAGSITSGFGSIDNGSSTITTTGQISGGSLNSATVDYASVLGIGPTSATKVEIGKTGAITEVEGNLDVLEGLDVTGNITLTGALQSGSITSGFGSIDNGSSTITTTGQISGGSLNSTTLDYAGVLDIGPTSATKVEIGKTGAITEVEGNLDVLEGLDVTGNMTLTGALQSGSITSGFGSIDNGSSTITTTGQISGGSLNSTTLDYAGVLGIGPTSATKVEVGKTGAITEVKGNLDVLEGLDVTGNVTLTGELDVPTSTTLSIGLTNATDVEFGANVVPDSNGTIDIGTDSLKFKDIYLNDTLRFTTNTNVLIGMGAIAQNVSGTHNVLLGNNVGENLTSSCCCVGIGNAAMRYLDDSGGNKNGIIAIGNGALTGDGVTSPTGANNCVIGFSAFGVATTGYDNTCVGKWAMKNTTTGHSNTVVGNSSQNLLGEYGNWNAMFGKNAGTACTGNENTMIGGATVGAAGTNNQTAIGYGATCDAANQITLGNASVTELRVNSAGTCDFGTSSEYLHDIYINGAIVNSGSTQTYIDLSDPGTDNMVMGTGTSGDALAAGAQYNIIVGASCAPALSTGDNNVFMGSNLTAESVTTANQCIIIGSQAGRFLTTGTRNIFIGQSAGRGITGAKLTGASNTCIGDECAILLQGAATQNTIIGGKAGKAITTASNNTLVGYNAGIELDANDTTYIGREAGLYLNGANNVCVGECAGQGVTATSTGTSNTFVGASAGLDITTGSSNACFGYLAGENLTTGAYNTFLGERAGDQTTTENYNVCLGYNANTLATVDKSIAIGYDAVCNADNICILGANASADAITLFAPGRDSHCSLGNSGNKWTEVWADDGTINTSDGKLKIIDATFDYGLSYIQEFKPISFKWTWGKRTHMGFNANDIGTKIKNGTIPDSGLYIENKQEDGSIDTALRKSELIAPLVKSVQELKAQIDELKSVLTTEQRALLTF